MAGLSSNSTSTAYVAEATAGTTPATPTLISLRHSTFNGRAEPIRSVTDVLQYGGQPYDVNQFGDTVTGQLDTEFSYGDYDAFLASLLGGAWATNVLKNGTTQTTFTIEDNIPLTPGTNRYFRYRGMEPVNMRLSASAKAVLQMQMNFRGYGADDATATAISGSSYGAASTSRSFNASADIGAIDVASYTLPCIESFELSVSVPKNDQPKLGSNDLCGISIGAPEISLAMRFYWETGLQAMYNDVRSGTLVDITLPLGSVSGSKYTILLPRAEFVLAAPVKGGRNTNVMMDARFRALYDTTEAAMIKITRAVS